MVTIHKKYIYIYRNKSICRTLLFVSFFYSLILSSQISKQDSLVNVISDLKSYTNFKVTDTTYILNTLSLAKELRYYNSNKLQSLSLSALQYSREAKYVNGQVNSFLLLGTYYSDHGEHKKSIEFYQKAYILSKKHYKTNLILDSKNSLALEYSYLGNYAKALDGYLGAIELATETDNKLMLSKINRNIANLYVSQGDYEQVLLFYKKVKKLNAEINNAFYSAETNTHMASTYADMEKLEYAMYHINASISFFEKEKKIDWLAVTYEVKGKVYLKKKNYKWALYWFNQSELLYKKIENNRGKINLLNGLSEAYLGQNKDDIAQEYALQGFALSKKLNSKEGIQKCAKTLYKVSKNKNDFETALLYHELFQKISDTLSTSENKKGLTMLKTKVEHDRQKEELIASNEKALAEQKNYVYCALFILLIFMVITYLIRRNEKIQKNLNIELNSKTQDLEKTEINLREINTTKDKLFSIIGHDLRGPIGAFQGLLKLFKNGEINQDEFLGFVPKLKSDIDHISFTLNNLLSWGQSQMNGAVTKPSNTNMKKIVADNFNLLLETATNKSITLVNHVPEDIMSWVDKNQIDIVIRNLTSNALKFTPEKGTVTIGLMEKRNHLEVFVKDTGIGMDVDTQKQIFAKNANLTTYGTNNEKGTGLGLSLCKEMIEKNNGKIWVTSRVTKGSCFYFTIPKERKQLQKIA